MALYNPKVSIIIPVFNGANYLRQAIDSAIAQSYENIEILVINDGSTDNSEDIALSYGEKIRYFKKENGGVSTALNLGISMMEGDYFSWLSHDDLYYKDKIKTQIQILSTLPNRGESIIYSNWDVIDENSNKIREVRLPTKRNPLLLELLTGSPLNGCTLLIPKECFINVGIFDTQLRNVQDVDLFFRFAQKYHFHFWDKSLVALRQHRNQVTYRTSNRHMDESNLFLITSFKKIGISKLGELASRSSNEVLELLLYNWSSRGYWKATRFLLANYRFSLLQNTNAIIKYIKKVIRRRAAKLIFR